MAFVLVYSKRVEANLQDLTTKSEKKKIEVCRDPPPPSASSSRVNSHSRFRLGSADRRAARGGSEGQAAVKLDAVDHDTSQTQLMNRYDHSLRSV